MRTTDWPSVQRFETASSWCAFHHRAPPPGVSLVRACLAQQAYVRDTLLSAASAGGKPVALLLVDTLHQLEYWHSASRAQVFSDIVVLESDPVAQIILAHCYEPTRARNCSDALRLLRGRWGTASDAVLDFVLGSSLLLDTSKAVSHHLRCHRVTLTRWLKRDGIISTDRFIRSARSATLVFASRHDAPSTDAALGMVNLADLCTVISLIEEAFGTTKSCVAARSRELSIAYFKGFFWTISTAM